MMSLRNLFLLSFLFIVLINSSQAQSPGNELVPGYYVVVAAYAPTKEHMAKAYRDKLNKDNYDASYGFNSSRGYYFVYLAYFTNLKDGLRSMMDTRKKGAFTDAWVRVVAGETKLPEKAVDPVTEREPATEKKEDIDTVETIVSLPQDSIKQSQQEKIIQHGPVTPGNTEVFLSLFNATNNRIIDGEIEVIDTDRARSIKKVKGNENIILPDPKSNSGQLTFIADVFGYRRVQQEINSKDLLADTVKSYVDLVGNTLVINFDMVRYRTGDIATLYQVYFYYDAAVMLPESRYQLGELLQMMNENPDYRIRLHGHTNGSYYGKIMTVGPDQDFFLSPSDANTTRGSAKHLSELRAEVIKRYPIKNGINGDRIEIRAWGGKRPIYDRRSVNAKKNVRVEVEILQD